MEATNIRQIMKDNEVTTNTVTYIYIYIYIYIYESKYRSEYDSM